MGKEDADMGKIWVVGIGPGAYEEMTVRAVRVLEECDTIIGYTVYVELVREHFNGKEFLTTPMKREEERCRLAFEEAAKGKKVAVICSGDAGVYGMSGLILETGKSYPDIPVERVPGVTAALSGAALLGAPLVHDFCLISLSDLLTPAEKISARLRSAAESDFVIVLYNPSSKKRTDCLRKACDICLEFRSPDTVCGCVRQIGREGESSTTLTLASLREAQTDMYTTVFIGNSQTKLLCGRMVTPRGYRSERDG